MYASKIQILTYERRGKKMEILAVVFVFGGATYGSAGGY